MTGITLRIYGAHGATEVVAENLDEAIALARELCKRVVAAQIFIVSPYCPQKYLAQFYPDHDWRTAR